VLRSKMTNIGSATRVTTTHQSNHVADGVRHCIRCFLNMTVIKTIGFVLLICTCHHTTAQEAGDALNSSPWQTSYPEIIRLKIALQRNEGTHAYHLTEDCSGTLINRKTGMILTAWHCFDGSIDLTQPPKAWLQGAWQELKLAANGGEMQNDWAIAYLIDPSVVDGPVMPLALGKLHAGTEIRMAGYQRTGVSHDDTQWQQVKTTCEVTRHSDYWIESNCHLNEGASGGAVMRIQAGKEYLVGIISARSPVGGVWFVPLSKLGAYLSPP
jgi:hypothetical protein